MLERLPCRSASRPSSPASCRAPDEAVAKHLARCVRAGLVSGSGRAETRYELDSAPLGDAAAWLERVGTEWDTPAALARHVDAGEHPRG